MMKPIRLFAVGLACFVAGNLVRAGLAYLPKLGPIPLRFQAPADTNQPKFQLAPLVVAPEPSAPDFTANLPPGPIMDLNQALPAPTPPPSAAHPGLAATTNTVIILTPTNAPPPAAEYPASQNDLLAPQMLLQFFQRRTNGGATSIIAPMGFTPPPPGSVSSTATYSTSP